MAAHTRLSPGVELYEIDRSQYNQKTDQSIVGTTVFMTGFADKGNDCEIQWIDKISTFQNNYGFPTNEIEKYLYNGVAEILNRGGICLVAKLPYKNYQTDKFTCVQYKLLNSNVDLSSNSDLVEELQDFDDSILSCASIEFDQTKTITLEEFDNCRVANSIHINGNGQNKILIVDITRQRYEKADIRDGENGSISKKNAQIIGIMPVIVGSANAVFFQNGVCMTNKPNVSNYNPISDISNREKDGSDEYIQSFSAVGSNFNQIFSSNDIDVNSLSKTAVQQFPGINWISNGVLEHKNLKYVSVVVFKIYRDQSNENNIGFTPVEVFTGSLDRNSKNEQTGASDYIGNIINSKSQYINLFTNIQKTSNFRNTDTYITKKQKAAVLGFYESECVKHIDYTDSILNPLGRILDNAQDMNQIPMDIVLDAGVSNIAQYVDALAAGLDQSNANMYPFMADGPDGIPSVWQSTSGTPPIWTAILRKFDDFCKLTRKDCMFIADCPRTMVLSGNEKIVRTTNYSNSIMQNIVPKIKTIQVLNSSYSAGYCNWFLVADEYSGDMFWCPPSIKMGGVYVYNDAYFHTWNAPAGMTRGKIRGALDVSFNPLRDQAGRIYQGAWNYAVNYPIDGIVAEGQKTFQIQQTALDRVNVRRLMLYLEKNVVRVARRFLYEGNTDYTRQRFVDTIQPIFEEAKNGDGISEYAIKCDAEINTIEAIENHEMHCIIGIKPIKAIEWIRIGFVITNQSADVNEEILN